MSAGDAHVRSASWSTRSRSFGSFWVLADTSSSRLESSSTSCGALRVARTVAQVVEPTPELLDAVGKLRVAARARGEILDARVNLRDVLRGAVDARGQLIEAARELVEAVGKRRIACRPVGELVDPVRHSLDPLGQLRVARRPRGEVVEAVAELLKLLRGACCIQPLRELVEPVSYGGVAGGTRG